MHILPVATNPFPFPKLHLNLLPSLELLPAIPRLLECDQKGLVPAVLLPAVHRSRADLFEPAELHN